MGASEHRINGHSTSADGVESRESQVARLWHVARSQAMELLASSPGFRLDIERHMIHHAAEATYTSITRELFPAEAHTRETLDLARLTVIAAIEIAFSDAPDIIEMLESNARRISNGNLYWANPENRKNAWTAAEDALLTQLVEEQLKTRRFPDYGEIASRFERWGRDQCQSRMNKLRARRRAHERNYHAAEGTPANGSSGNTAER